MDKKRYESFINTRKLIENVTPDLSSSPLDLLRKSKARAHFIDTELVNLYEVRKDQAGYRPRGIEPKTKTILHSGGTMLDVVDMVQFASHEKDFGTGTSRLHSNLYRRKDELENVKWWEGSTDVQRLINTGTAGLAPNEFKAKVKQYFSDLGNGGRKTLLLGYNALHADREWLKQFGADFPKNVHYVDVYDLARIAFPGQNYQGGIKLEVLKDIVLKNNPNVRGLTSHTATDDNAVASELFDLIISPENWGKMSDAQKFGIYKHLSPFLHDMPAVAGRTISNTIDFFQAASAEDPYLINRYKFEHDRGLFQETVGGKSILRKIHHSGSDRGLERIKRALGTIDDDTVKQFEILHQNLKSYSNGRLEFALQRKGGLGYLYITALDGSVGAGATRNVLAHAALPLQQSLYTGQKSLVTMGDTTFGVRGGFLEKTASGFRKRSFNSLFFEAMNRALDPKKAGGIVATEEATNLGSNLLKAIVSNAERMAVLMASGEEGADFSSVRYDSSGKTLNKNALKTALIHIGSMRGEKTGVLAGLESEFQFLLENTNNEVWSHLKVNPEKLKKAEVRQISAFNEIFYKINVQRSNAIKRGATPVEGSDIQGLKKVSEDLLNFFREEGLNDLDLSFYGVKPESLMRGIVSGRGGVHTGITKRTGPKGSYELKSLEFFGASARSSVRAAQMVPRNFIPGIKGAYRRGLPYIPGRVASFGIIRTSGEEGKLASYLYGGDASIIATRRGISKLNSGTIDKKIFVTDLHSDLLDLLTSKQKEKLFMSRGKVRFNKLLSEGHKMGINYKDNSPFNVLFSNNTEGVYNRLVGISTVRGQQGYYLEMSGRMRRDRDAVGRSMIIGGQRATVSSLLSDRSLRDDVDFISYDEFNKPADLKYQHIVNKINARGKGKEFKEFLERNTNQKIQSVATSNDPRDFFYEAPNLSSKELEKYGEQFASQNNIDIAPRIVTLSDNVAAARGVPKGTKMEIYDTIVSQRVSERTDIGKKIGGALRLRLKDAAEAQSRALASGYSKQSVASQLIGEYFDQHSPNHQNFRKYFEYLASGGEKLPAGVKTYTLRDIQEGRLLGTNTSGFVTRDSVKGTVADIHRNSLFAIDLGSPVGAVPLRKNQKRIGPNGEEFEVAGRALAKRRILLLPSATMAGFGLSEGATKMSTSDPFTNIVEGINLLRDGSVEPEAAAYKIFLGYEKFHKNLFGKNKLFDTHYVRSRGLRNSGQFRNILSARNSDIKYLQSGRAVGTVELEEGYIRKHRKKLGISKEFVKRISSGGAYGMLSINPHMSLQHSAMVRYTFRKGSKDSLSANIGTHAFLSKVIRRDYDQDKIFALFFDKRIKNRTQLNNFYNSLKEEWEHFANTDYENIAHNITATLKRQFNIESGKGAGTEQTVAEMLSDFVSGKGLAANPYLKIRGEEIVLSDYFKFANKDKSVAADAIKNEFYRAFKLESGAQRSTKATELAAEIFGGDLHRLARSQRNWAVFQEELSQQSLQKAGQLREAATIFGDEISSLQSVAFDMFGQEQNTSDTYIKNVYENLRARAKTSAETFMRTVESEKGLMNLGTAVRFDDLPGIQSLVDDFATNQAAMHLLYGAVGFDMANGNPEKKQFNLGRAHVLNKLTKNNADKDQISDALRFLGLSDNLDNMGTTYGQAQDNFRSYIGTEIEKMASEAVEQQKAGSVRAQPILDTIEKSAQRISKNMMEGGAGIIDLISNLPNSAKMGLGVVGAYAAYSQLSAGSSNDLGVLSAPDIESSRVMRSSLPKTPMVSTPDVRYPDPINPASYRNKALIQRASPMIQFHGRQISSNPYGSALDIADTIGGANIANGQINIYDNRSHSDMQSQFAARDAIASDY